MMHNSEDILPARFVAAEKEIARTGSKWTFNAEKTLSYHRAILQRGHCQGFLPVQFLKLGKKMEMQVETEGYLPILEHRRRKEKSRWLCCAQEMLNVLEALILTIRDNEEHLFFIWQYELKPETVFLHSKEQTVKLLYQCVNTVGERGFALQLAAFLESLEETETDQEWLFYSQHIRRECVRDNLGLRLTLKLVRRLKEEAAGSQWGSS